MLLKMKRNRCTRKTSEFIGSKGSSAGRRLSNGLASPETEIQDSFQYLVEKGGDPDISNFIPLLYMCSSRFRHETA